MFFIHKDESEWDYKEMKHTTYPLNEKDKLTVDNELELSSHLIRIC